eukprot:PLAT596.1.p1 GENE.PLAT596.1~~PLAT596.1.p1  ORF type:complete len:1238 (+),score=533.21 PLAT596.1:62-3715(+)
MADRAGRVPPLPARTGKYMSRRQALKEQLRREKKAARVAAAARESPRLMPADAGAGSSIAPVAKAVRRPAPASHRSSPPLSTASPSRRTAALRKKALQAELTSARTAAASSSSTAAESAAEARAAAAVAARKAAEAEMARLRAEAEEAKRQAAAEAEARLQAERKAAEQQAVAESAIAEARAARMAVESAGRERAAIEEAARLAEEERKLREREEMESKRQRQQQARMEEEQKKAAAAEEEALQKREAIAAEKKETEDSADGSAITPPHSPPPSPPAAATAAADSEEHHATSPPPTAGDSRRSLDEHSSYLLSSDEEEEEEAGSELLHITAAPSTPARPSPTIVIAEDDDDDDDGGGSGGSGGRRDGAAAAAVAVADGDEHEHKHDDGDDGDGDAAPSPTAVRHSEDEDDNEKSLRPTLVVKPPPMSSPRSAPATPVLDERGMPLAPWAKPAVSPTAHSAAVAAAAAAGGGGGEDADGSGGESKGAEESGGRSGIVSMPRRLLTRHIFRRAQASSIVAATKRGHTGEVLAIALAADRSKLFSVGTDSLIKQWDADSGDCDRTFKQPGRLTCVAASEDNASLFTGSLSGEVWQWDLLSGVLHARMEGSHAGGISALVLSPCGTWVITGSTDGTAKRWNIERNVVEMTYHAHVGGITALLLSADGFSLFTGGRDGLVREWDVRCGAALRTLGGHDYSVSALCLSPNGRLLYSGSGDRTVREWSLRSSKCLRTFTGPTLWVTDMAVTDNGHVLYVACRDETARGIALSDGEIRETFAGHTHKVNCMALAGSRLFTGSSDSQVLEWKLPAAQRYETIPSNAFRSATWLEVTMPLADYFIVTLQLLAFPFSQSFPWAPSAEVFQITFPALSLDIRITFYHRLYAVFAAMGLFVLLAFTDALHRLMHASARLAERADEQHDVRLAERKAKLDILALIVWVLMWALSVLTLLPALRAVFEVVDCTFNEAGVLYWDRDPNVQCFVGFHGMITIIAVGLTLLYVPYAVRLGATTGDATLLVSKREWGCCKRVRHHLCTSWYAESFHRKNLNVGVLSTHQVTYAKFHAYNAWSKLAFAGFDVMLTRQPVVLAFAYLALTVLMVCANVWYRPFAAQSANRVMFASRCILLWTCSVGLVVVYINDLSANWLVTLWYIGVAPVFLLAYCMSNVLFRLPRAPTSARISPADGGTASGGDGGDGGTGAATAAKVDRLRGRLKGGMLTVAVTE